LVAGSANGKLNELFNGITKINTKYGPFDLLLCVGDLFGDNLGEIDSLISGEVKVPITTYFMYGEHELPDAVKERVESNQGEFCSNLYYLGQQGSMTTIHGVKIAFVSGVMSAMVNDLPSQVDILLTYEWPKSITRLSSTSVPDGIEGSGIVASLVTKVKPRYHFAAAEKISFLREPYQNAPSSNLASEIDDTQLQFGLPTWFVGLAEVGNTKSKWYYGFNLVPYVHLPPSNFINPPENMTECPFFQSSTGQKRGFGEIQGDGNFFWSTRDSSEQANKRGRRNTQGPPPEGYVCNKCNLPGHWISECRGGQPRPPKNYVCKKCNLAGVHFIVDCPSFTCKLCGEKGHTPKNCSNSSAINKKSNNAKSAAPCWFCLSNPKTVKHLILSVGNETYLSLAKGSLIDTQDPSVCIVPGGGHVLIVAISHCSSFREIPVEDRLNLTDEVEKYKSSLKKFYQAYGAGMVLFEVSLQGKKNQHCHIQVVPVPLEHDSEKIRKAFIEEASASDLKLRPVPSPVPINCFKVDFPDGSSLVHDINPNEQFDVQFGRRVLGKLLGLSHRVNWRDCQLSEELERTDAEKFMQAFMPYKPMIQDNF
ncbi:11481_t:CDS:10, partial [Acaulospora morrowiae]